MLGRTISEENARQILHRARHRFADCLLQEVGRSLDSRSRDEIETEVIELGLLNYCRQALQRLPPGA
jgi:hypothetical protein